jgi:hypothetical protein
MEEKKSVFVGIPAFSVYGDAMDDGVLDACAEAFEIPPSEIKVIEYDDSFYVFTDEMPLDIHAANHTIVTASNLNRDYEHAIHYITKLVRRSDSLINKQRELQSNVRTLRSNNEKLKLKLQDLEKKLSEKKQKSQRVENEMEAVIAGFQ